MCVRVCLRHCRYESMSIFGSVTEKIWSIVGLSMVCVQVMMRLLENLSDFRLRDLTSSIITEDQKSLIFLVQVSNPPKVWVHILHCTQF